MYTSAISPSCSLVSLTALNFRVNESFLLACRFSSVIAMSYGISARDLTISMGLVKPFPDRTLILFHCHTVYGDRVSPACSFNSVFLQSGGVFQLDISRAYNSTLKFWCFCCTFLSNRPNSNLKLVDMRPKQINSECLIQLKSIRVPEVREAYCFNRMKLIPR